MGLLGILRLAGAACPDAWYPEVRCVQRARTRDRGLGVMYIHPLAGVRSRRMPGILCAGAQCLEVPRRDVQ
jgi:hypothetical protein